MKEIKKDDLILKLGTLFYFCSIFGFVYELILCYIDTGKLFSHGILSGPWLPIYGTGAILVMTIQKYRNTPFLIFALSFFITGILEYICGFILLKFLKKRLWDYTGYFLNIGGHVCLLSAFCFGIGGLLITYIFYPLVNKIVKKLNQNILNVGLTLITLIFIGDIFASIVK